jgi:hypothetical protein
VDEKGCVRGDDAKLWKLVRSRSRGSLEEASGQQVSECDLAEGPIFQYSVVFPRIQLMSREFLVFGWMILWLAS